jgi:2-oxoglutarate dehydrogenase E2 component (dihydrolipoamide succinyltransferase)
MPQLGETVTEGTVTRWLKSIGEHVDVDEPLLEVSTDKVDTEIPSALSGVLHEILIPEGETVPVGTVLARIGDSAALDVDDDDDSSPQATEPASEEPAAPLPSGPDPDSPQSTTAPALAESPIDIPEVPAPRRRVRDGDSGGFLSPVVRRLLEEHQVDPGEVAATGAGGRLTAADVRAHVRMAGHAPGTPAPTGDRPSASPGPPPPAVTSAPSPPSASPGIADPPTATDGDHVVPFSSIRRRTATHMVMSLATSAHTLVAIEVDYHRIEQVRAHQKEAFREREGVGLSYLPFIARAVVDAIGEYPSINASVGADELIVHREVNLGIAVDLDFEGLIVPVIRQAHHLRLAALTRAMADQAAKARAGSLAPDDVTGGTFTITNAGGYGTLLTTPIIAQPQVAILSTDGVAMRPAAIRQPGGAWGLTVHPLGNLALSFDHRAFDGAYASAFMARIREILQDRDWAAEVGA